MGTMRNNFTGAFVLLILMLTTSQSFPYGKENSSKRNSLANTLNPKVRPTYSVSTYECLFVDETLPTCDAKWMLDSYEDDSTENVREKRNLEKFGKHTAPRPKNDIDASTRVIVYTFEGCIPPIRLQFLMPLCEGISLDNIVGVERFYPFAVKGVKEPPFVFPEVSHDQWLRMMTRLRNHASSKAGNKKQHFLSESNSGKLHGRTDELMKTVSTKETTPNTIVANMNISNGSSSSRLIPSEPKESTNEDSEIIDHEKSRTPFAMGNIGNTNGELPASSRDSSRARSRGWINNRRNKMKSRSRKKRKIFHKADQRGETVDVDRRTSDSADEDENFDAILPTSGSPSTVKASGMNRSFHKESAIDELSNKLEYRENLKNFLKPLLGTQRENDDGIGGDLNELSLKGSFRRNREKKNDGILDESNGRLSEVVVESFRRKREIRVASDVSNRAIPDETKVLGIAGKSLVEGLKGTGEKSGIDKLVVLDDRKESSKNLKIDE